MYQRSPLTIRSLFTAIFVSMTVLVGYLVIKIIAWVSGTYSLLAGDGGQHGFTSLSLTFATAGILVFLFMKEYLDPHLIFTRGVLASFLVPIVLYHTVSPRDGHFQEFLYEGRFFLTWVSIGFTIYLWASALRRSPAPHPAVRVEGGEI